MSSYNSNESHHDNEQNLRNILPVFSKELIDNLAVNDIKPHLEKFFSKTEIDYICNEKEGERQIFHLLWWLERKSELQNGQFVEMLVDYYNFIKRRIMRELSEPQESTSNYLKAKRKLLNLDQKFIDYNVRRLTEFCQLREAILSLRPLKMLRNIVVRGDLGVGKKWLVLDVLTEYTVLKSLNFKVYWLDVKSCVNNETTVVKLQELRHLIDANYRFSSLNEIEKTIEHQQTMLARLFEDKNDCESLVVLVDVQKQAPLKAFLKLGCKLLVLTRYERVSGYLSNQTTKCIELNDKLTFPEIETLFALYSQKECNASLKSKIVAIYTKTRNPLKLSFIASILPVSDWENWEKNNFSKLTQIVESSLNVLNEEHQRKFAALSIFREDAEIPIEILPTLWSVTSEDCKDILAVFKKNSLIKYNSEERTIRLSNIYSDQLSKSKKITDMINKSDLHAKVVESFNIDIAFKQRTDPELANLPKYFYSHIIDHLKELTEPQRSTLFQQVLLDFGFLEKKIRMESCKILITLQQLNFYKKQQFCTEDLRKLLQEIVVFLPKVEEKLMHSSDTCLLQYALMENGVLYKEAKRQMRWYPNQVWLTETGRFHQRRQLLQLGNQPRKAIYLDSEECLVEHKDNSIKITNLSLEQNTGDTQLLNNQAIRQWSVLNRQQELLTLDRNGKISLYSLNTNRTASGTQLMHRHSSRRKEHSLKSITQRSTITTIRSAKWTYNAKRVVSIHIQEYCGKIELYVACDNGDVRPFDWIKKGDELVFQPVSALPIATKLKNEHEIRFISKLLNQYILLLSSSGTISIWRIRDTSEVYKRTIADAGQVIHMTTYDNDCNDTTIALFVFSHKVFAMHFPKCNQNLDFDVVDLKSFYEQPSNEEGIISINCAKLSYDNCYLLLGTDKGLIVVDVATQLSVLCTNISEKIVCLDISCLDKVSSYDPKYIVLCGAEGNTFLHVYAIRTADDDKKITWLHHVECMANKEMQTDNVQLEPDVRWRGERLYDVTYGKNGKINLWAVDSKNRIHQVNQINPIDNSNEPITLQAPNVLITAMTSYGVGDLAFVGYRNGFIFNIEDGLLQQDFLVHAIDYLHLLDEHTLIAASFESARTLIVRHYDASNLSDDVDNYIKLDFFTRQAYKLSEHCLLLIASDSLQLRNLNEISCEIKSFDTYTAWDYQQSLLFLATSSNFVQIYRYTNSDELTKLNECEVNNRSDMENEKITCLAAAPDGSLLALGYYSGNIELYKYRDNKLHYIFQLQSHAHKIMKMRFSPEKDVLVSCAEQICFWNVNYMLNNELSNSNTTQRRSSRFSVQRSNEDKGTEEVDAMPIKPYARHLPVGNERNDDLRYAVLNSCTSGGSQWQNKQGHASKRELFACIKFDGNEAEKFFANNNFTQFDMIDNEGVYYQLRLLDTSTLIDSPVNDNANDDVFYSLERSLTSDVNLARDIALAHENGDGDGDVDDGGFDVVYDSVKSNNTNNAIEYDVSPINQDEEGATALPLTV